MGTVSSCRPVSPYSFHVLLAYESELSFICEKFLPCKWGSSGFLGCSSWHVTAPSLWNWVRGAFPPCQSQAFYIALGNLKDFVTPWIEYKPCSRHDFDAVSNFRFHNISVTFIIADRKSPGLGTYYKMHARLPVYSIHLKNISCPGD